MRKLYLIVYDISDPSRLNQVRLFLKAYTTGGQKSVCECFLTEAELGEVEEGLSNIMDIREDRIYCFRLDLRSKVHTLGIGIPPKDPEFFYFG